MDENNKQINTNRIIISCFRGNFQYKLYVQQLKIV